MSVFFDRDRQVWRYDFQYRGKRYAKECVHPITNEIARNKTEATDIEEFIRANEKEKHRANPTVKTSHGGAFTLANAAEIYLSRGSLGSTTMTNRMADVKEVLHFFGADSAIVSIDTVRVSAYVKWTADGGLGRTSKSGTHRAPRNPSTVNRITSTLRTLFTIAHKAKDPVTGQSALPHMVEVPRQKTPDRIPTPIPDRNLLKIRAHALPWTLDAIDVSRTFGFRHHEIRAVTTEWFDLDSRLMVMPAKFSKSNRDDVMPLNDDAMALLRRLFDQAKARKTKYLVTWPRYTPRPGQEIDANAKWVPITASFRGGWYRACRLAGFDPHKHKIHHMRSTFITAAAAKNVLLARDLARHSSINTTMLYVGKVTDGHRATMNAATSGWRPPAPVRVIEGTATRAKATKAKATSTSNPRRAARQAVG